MTLFRHNIESLELILGFDILLDLAEIAALFLHCIDQAIVTSNDSNPWRGTLTHAHGPILKTCQSAKQNNSSTNWFFQWLIPSCFSDSHVPG